MQNFGPLFLQLCNKDTKVTNTSLRYFLPVLIWDSEVMFKTA